METLFSIGLLIVFGIISNFLMLFILNIGGVPGALIAGTPGKRSKSRFITGSIIASFGQSYIYLAYIAFIVSWTKLAASQPDITSYLIWPIAFLVVLGPIWFNLIRARVENKEQEHASAQVEALHLTLIVSLFGFFIFVFFEKIMSFGWGWVPYVN